MRKSVLTVGSATLSAVVVGGAVFVATASGGSPLYDTTQREGVQYACVDEDGSLAYFQTRRPGDPGWSDAAYFCWDGEGGLTRWAFPYEAPPAAPGEEPPPTTEPEPTSPTSEWPPSPPEPPPTEVCEDISFWDPGCGSFKHDVQVTYHDVSNYLEWRHWTREVKSATYVIDGVRYEAEVHPPVNGNTYWSSRGVKVEGLDLGRRLAIEVEWGDGTSETLVARLIPFR